jgi:hypothetical protein
LDRRTCTFVIASALVSGCSRPAAPPDLDALTRSLYRDWPQTQALSADLSQLAVALSAYDLTSNLSDRSFQISPPSADDLTSISWPMDRDPQSCIGSSVARQSPWSVGDFAQLEILPDQLPVEPSAKAYARSFVAPTDPSCFADRSCLEVDTDNTVTRSNALYSMTFVMHKQFVWAQVDGGWAIVARDWIDQPYPFDAHNGALDQAYSLDVFAGRSDGTTVRYQAVWSETDLPVATTDDLQRLVVTSSVDDGMQAADRVIQQRFHP